MNNSPVAKAQHTVSANDQHDALRIVEAAVTLAAIPGMASPAARELATTRLREMIANHPRNGELLAAVVQHVESYP